MGPFDLLPMEIIIKIVSHLPMIDCVRCKRVSKTFHTACCDSLSKYTVIPESEVPIVRYVPDMFKNLMPDYVELLHQTKTRWKLTENCPNITDIQINDQLIRFPFFEERLPYFKHFHVVILSYFILDTYYHYIAGAKSLVSAKFFKSNSSDYNIIQFLPDQVEVIEGPPITNPYQDRADDMFRDKNTARFTKLRKLTILQKLKENDQLENLLKLENITYIRFKLDDNAINNRLIRYLELRGPRLVGLDLYQSFFQQTCGVVYDAVRTYCRNLKEFGWKGTIYGSVEITEPFPVQFSTLNVWSLNVERAIGEQEVVDVCTNNQNLTHFNYSLLLSQVRTYNVGRWIRFTDEAKRYVDNFNAIHGRNIIFGTSELIQKTLRYATEYDK